MSDKASSCVYYSEPSNQTNGYLLLIFFKYTWGSEFVYNYSEVAFEPKSLKEKMDFRKMDTPLLKKQWHAKVWISIIFSPVALRIWCHIRQSLNSTNQYWKAILFLLTKNASKSVTKNISILLFYPANTKFMRLISLNQYNTTSRLKRNPICGRPIYHPIQKFEKLRHKQKNIANLIIRKTLGRALHQG